MKRRYRVTVDFETAEYLGVGFSEIRISAELAVERTLASSGVAFRALGSSLTFVNEAECFDDAPVVNRRGA